MYDILVEFVGGRMDGERRAVPGPVAPPKIEFAVHSVEVAMMIADPDLVSVPIRNVVYERWKPQGERGWLYRHVPGAS